MDTHTHTHTMIMRLETGFLRFYLRKKYVQQLFSKRDCHQFWNEMCFFRHSFGVPCLYLYINTLFPKTDFFPDVITFYFRVNQNEYDDDKKRKIIKHTK